MSKATEKLYFKRIILSLYFSLCKMIDVGIGFFIAIKNLKKCSDKRIYLIGTPEHDNLGDHAIAMAEYKFINTYFPEYNIIEISIEKFYRYIISLTLNLSSDDIFMLTGGGNMGNIYLPDEKVRRFIVKHFPNNKIIIMPQTVYFTSNKNGGKELEISSKIYNSHKKLLICAREDYSQKIMEKQFSNCYVMLCPDMVFSLNYSQLHLDREYIGICLRSDIEKSLTDKQHMQIENVLHKSSLPVKYIETCLSSGILPEKREYELMNFLETVSRCRVVITDRLHGMVFSVITSTPCIVFNNFNYKIFGSYQWVKSLPFIRLVDNIDNLENMLLELLDIRYTQYNDKEFSLYYAKLAKIIECEL